MTDANALPYGLVVDARDGIVCPLDGQPPLAPASLWWPPTIRGK